MRMSFLPKVLNSFFFLDTNLGEGVKVIFIFVGKSKVLIFKREKLGEEIDCLDRSKARKILASKNGTRIKTGTKKKKVLKSKEGDDQKKTKENSLKESGGLEAK